MIACDDNSESMPILKATGIVKTFPGVRALDGVSLAIFPGAVNALLGENGAGKSTLMKILTGVIAPDSGTICLAGDNVAFRTPREAQEAGVSIIFQELNIVPNISVAENIYLGREPTTPVGLVDFARMVRDSAALLERLRLRVDVRRPAGQLSVASQQVVEIARALSFQSKVLILDEPTSALTEEEVAALFRVIRQLKSEGVGLVYITHRLEELAEVADDVTVFRDGKFVATKPFSQTTPDELVRLMVGHDTIASSEPVMGNVAEPILVVDQLSLPASGVGDVSRAKVDDVSFQVSPGEVLGIYGLLGAGRTELLQAVFGVYPRHATGTITVGGKRRRFGSPADAIRAGLAYAPEDRKNDGLVLGMSVAQNISLSCCERVSTARLLQRRQEDQLASDYIARLAIKTPSLQQAVQNLSGGNQQKVVLAKCLATNPRVLLLDEPTRGIDIGAKQEIYRLIRELASQGLAVVLVSSEMPELLALSHRILVLSEGKLTGEFKAAEATQGLLLKAALPSSKRARVA